MRIKDAKAILYDGTEVNLNGEISPEVCGFEFELNARISEWSGGITLNGEPLDLNYDGSRKTLVSKSDGVLIGDGKYIIKTNDKIKNADGVSIRQYENSFVTSRGGIRVADLNWYNRDGAKIEPNTLGAIGTKASHGYLTLLFTPILYSETELSTYAKSVSTDNTTNLTRPKNSIIIIRILLLYF